MMTIAILAVAVMTSVATPTAVYKRTASSSAETSQSTKAASNCHKIRALTLNGGFSQVLRCEPENGVAGNDHAAVSHRFSVLGK
jgi:hypothetical protein